MLVLGIILISCSIFFFIYSIVNNKKQKNKILLLEEQILSKQSDEIKQKLYEQEEQLKKELQELQVAYKREKTSQQTEVNEFINNLNKIKELEEQKYKIQIENLQNKIKDLEENYKKEKEKYDSFLESSLDSANQQIDLYKTEKMKTANIEVDTMMAARRQQKQDEFEKFVAEYEEKKLLYSTEIETILASLEDHKKKQDALNQEILRRRAIEEQQDFYRICISDSSKEDMTIINSFLPQIHEKTKMNKLIYDNYISKPTLEMAKRVLSGRDPSGIYKITNIHTGEIYVGQSTTVKTRWCNHVKAACGLDGVADSMFQRALKKYGVDSFTFELLEEVPKENLREREKFYIISYESDKYGYNQKIG